MLYPTIVRGAYAYDSDAASDKSGVDCSFWIDKEGEIREGGLAQQQFAEDADINNIVRRFGLTGEMPEALNMPTSGDFSGVGDFHEVMNLVTKAEAEFMSLPADVRYRFANDPGRLMEFLENDANRGEAEKLGLVNKPPEKVRDVVTAVDELRDVLVAKPL